MTRSTQVQEDLDVPAGFSFSALAAGIKISGKPDLALVKAVPGTVGAALFTTNHVAAAPVHVGRAHIVKSRGSIRAVIVNSGNANCATGNAGLRDCLAVCEGVARSLAIRPAEVFPSSTGIIGVPLPTKKIVNKLPMLASGSQCSANAFQKFAEAIMTTDTRRKIASAKLKVGKAEIRLLGVAKGAGMIHPQMATMLVYLFTDAVATPVQVKRFLKHACDTSLNCISIDGDTSTNDTVLLLASGQARIRLSDPVISRKFSVALGGVCASLAEQIVADGEGVQHVIRLHIVQARTNAEALSVARTISHSLLVKTAWAGADPNWGRILAAVGRSGINVNPKKVSIFIGRQEVCRGGMVRKFSVVQAHHDLSQPTCDVRVALGRGKAKVRFLTSDLSAEYVHINADYST